MAYESNKPAYFYAFRDKLRDLRSFVWLASVFMGLAFFSAKAQTDTTIAVDITIPRGQPTDLLDLLSELFHKDKTRHADTGSLQSRRFTLSAAPAAGYTLQTGFAVLLVGNATFYTTEGANTSTALTSFTYTARNQIILPLQSSIWTKNNKYNIVIDWRYLKYPSYTYGLGGYTSLNNGYLVDYSAIRLHQTVLRKVVKEFYAGVGYNLDYYWNIKELNPPPNSITDFEKYGFNGSEFASGFTFNVLHDTRGNLINPQGGDFINVIYRPNLVVFGNTSTWRSLVVDLRKYFRFPTDSKNILTFWNYEWLTVSGRAPYLMLPNTAGDPYSNTGRGYIQGRFRGLNMAYLEGEYRFGITHNGLLGGVVFANAQTFTEIQSYHFEKIAPGWGAGIRVKLNKYSNTNIALDYGFGLNGQGGLFVNLGEVF